MREIKIRDLSIGDWVAIESAQLAIEGNDIATAFVDKVKQPIQIVSVLGDEQLVFGRIEELDGFTTIYLKAEHIKPIPLTPEILEKNGFVKCGRCCTSRTTAYIKDFTFVNHLEERKVWRVKIYGEEGLVELCSILVHHTHQLQHALRLAGVEKEIEV